MLSKLCLFCLTVTIQNMFKYHYHSKKHVRIPLGTANINAYFQETDLPGYFTVGTSNFIVATFLI